ncbi:hypothetical protein D3C77_696210 [compost metagenome]
MVELAQDRQSWLGRLLSAYGGLFEPPREAKRAKVDPSLALITAVSVGEPVQAELELPALADWQQQIRLLAARFREGMSEW